MNTKSQDFETNRRLARELPLQQIDVSDGYLFRDDSIGHYFARLREEDPVHFQPSSRFGPFWSITRFKDIREVELNHEAFSSAQKHGGITLTSPMSELQLGSFIAMDPPRHDEQRKTVNSVAMPANLAKLEATIRQRTCTVLDSLPVNKEFDWVENVSVNLTTQMLATLFDFPFEERHLLTWWSDMATGHAKDAGPVTSTQMQKEELNKCFEYFSRLWEDRIKAPPANDLISMMAHSTSTRNMPKDEYCGNLLLLIVGGNDTTRNSMSGGVLALHEHQNQFEKLQENPSLVSSLVPEIIRWQTPLAHMARTAVKDTVVAGKTIRTGDRLALWYLSANRDPEVIDQPDEFIIDRKNPRLHLSFGFGIHHCMGSRLAELQLRILWEELLPRFSRIAVTGKPERTLSNFVRGFNRLPVTLST
ncbi:MAG: cytochrome P450 [Burkholderiaceae bacterium]